jgi:uncharacterized cupin superfamily protein
VACVQLASAGTSAAEAMEGAARNAAMTGRRTASLTLMPWVTGARAKTCARRARGRPGALGRLCRLTDNELAPATPTARRYRGRVPGPNVYRPDLEPQDRQNGFASKRALVARAAGARKLGASVFEVGPGESHCPYHLHYANEEMVVALKGTLSLRTPDGWREMAEGEVAAFPAGTEGAHQLSNFSDEVVRYMVVSTMRAPEVCVYPDSGKISAEQNAPGDVDGHDEFHRSVDQVDYFLGETAPKGPDA